MFGLNTADVRAASDHKTSTLLEHRHCPRFPRSVTMTWVLKL